MDRWFPRLVLAAALVVCGLECPAEAQPARVDAAHALRVLCPKRVDLAPAFARAAVALENHESDIVDDPIAGRAWMAALDVVPDPEDYDAVDIEAARLLRECVVKGEPLP